MKYARIVSGSVVEVRDFGVAPNPNASKGLDWRPLTPGTPPTIDPKTHKIVGPNYTVNAEDVVESFSSAALDGAEIAAKKSAAVSSINGLFRPIMKALLDHENRIREGETPPRAAITLAQFEAQISGLL